MYECLNCGHIFDEPGWYREYRGECFGFPAWEPMAGCPICHGAFMEITEENDGEI